ncbi:amino acid permease 3-like [Zingiber officinale]|uniref:amino acid permease 3-like n=1 Tax=Zingiber officinale TaxID=94328 RepID=UPI001C4B3C3B|nr:amino acid permease 3-like [Zingiber officinale]
MSENGAAMCCQQTAFAPQSISLELGDGHQTVDGGSECYDDDDGRTKRTGTLWMASAHIVTAVIGSGVLSLAWATGKLFWASDPMTGKHSYNYMNAIRCGGKRSRPRTIQR